MKYYYKLKDINLYQINPHCLPGSIAKLLKVAKEDFEGKD